jgi:hypothetical protein
MHRYCIEDSRSQHLSRRLEKAGASNAVYQFLPQLQHSNFDEGTAPITSDDMLIVLNSGCTCAITFDKDDFVGQIRPVQDVELQGISSGLRVAGVGQVNWMLLNEFGHRTTIPLTCLYAPDATTRLLPPQQIATRNGASNANGSWVGYGNDALVFYEGDCIKFPYHEGSNPPVAKLAPGISKFEAFHASTMLPSSTATQQNDNLSAASRKLLRIHHRLGHKGFHELQKWAADGTHGVPRECATCPIPLCRACQYGAAKKRPHETSNTGSVSGAPEHPGDFVSVDQMVAGSPGLIPYTNGRPSKRRYDTVTMWVDHYSRFLYAHCQEDATIKSTLESKDGFESFAKRYNVSIKHIHCDIGVFSTKVFREHVEASDQQQSFCEVGAHWQNGVIERFIGVITTRARTMLLHAMDKWPDVVTAEFWSFAFMQAVRLHYRTPRPGETESPLTLFREEDSPLSFHDSKPFGCTTVLPVPERPSPI